MRYDDIQLTLLFINLLLKLPPAKLPVFRFRNSKVALDLVYPINNELFYDVVACNDRHAFYFFS